MELYKKYRPKQFKEVVGQENAVNTLTQMVNKNNVPHAILFSGPSGCGKTTLARILTKKVGCVGRDCVELNAANFRGIEMVRQIQDNIDASPMCGRSRVWIIDECHQLTKDAQNASLKVLEDTPSHAYLMLCTTDPTKLLRTIVTRCTEIKISGMSGVDLGLMTSKIAKEEGIKLGKEELKRLVEVADGSARKALVILDQIKDLPEKEMLDAIQKSDTKRQAIDLARALIKPNPNWNEVKKIVKEIEDDPESVRRMVLGYISSVCLGGGQLANRAAQIFEVFRDNFYDTGKSGLVFASFACCKGV